MNQFFCRSISYARVSVATTVVVIGSCGFYSMRNPEKYRSSVKTISTQGITAGRGSLQGPFIIYVKKNSGLFSPF